MDSFDSFTEYSKNFIQRWPRYAVKFKGRTWRTKHKPLADRPVQAHLDQAYSVATLGRWYPSHGVLDFDSVPLALVNETRSALGMDSFNSMLCSSESQDSYHVLFRPQYRARPMTVKLLQDILRGQARRYGFEIWPQSNKVMRLPFGYKQLCLDLDYQSLNTWQDQLYWYNKLDEFDLETVPSAQLTLDFGEHDLTVKAKPSWYVQGQVLLEHGLQAYSTRNESQAQVLYSLWRLNIPRDQAAAITWQWIQKHHNGFSQDILRRPQAVKAEIKRQAAHIYEKYELPFILPDEPHNRHHGFITKADIPEIVQAAGGSLPRMKFLFHLVKWCYTRRHRQFINIHSDRLKQWSSKSTYLKYLAEFETKGLLQRSRSYSVDRRFSKTIVMNWRWQDKDQVLQAGRSISTFADTVRLTFQARDFRDLLSAQGISKQTVFDILRVIWSF